MSFCVRLGEITFPVAPMKITVTQKSRNRTVDLIDGSQTVIAKGPALREYRMELLLPRTQYPFAVYRSGFRAPEAYLDVLERYARKGKPVELIIERGLMTESCPVYVGDMTCSETAGDGADITLSLCLLASDEENAYAKIPSTYRVQNEDTLRLIARRIWGDETRATALYYANETLIEEAARGAGFADSRRGEHLIPGILLIIPEEVEQYGDRR